jgi:hypothetical protein
VVGRADGPGWFEREAGNPRATASTIKTFYVVELFDTAAEGVEE